MKLKCSHCGRDFERDNEFSLLGYRQCLACDYKMFEATANGERWAESDKKVHEEK
jgi:DNA-directed RNA polymerase subunit RPC12/RpoP